MWKQWTRCKEENILKGILDSIPSASPSVEVQIMCRKVCLRYKAKHCWSLSTNVLLSKVCWHPPVMFCLISSSKLFHQFFNFHWSRRWWDQIQSILLNLFYFKVCRIGDFWTFRMVPNWSNLDDHLDDDRFIISLESFRSFRGALFCKPKAGQKLFFAVSYSKVALEPLQNMVLPYKIQCWLLLWEIGDLEKFWMVLNWL